MIPNWLMQRAYLTPEKMALSVHDQTWTFKDVYEEAMKRARQLKTAHLHSGDRIALMGASNVDMVMMIHASMLLGVEMVMLNNRLTEEEIAYQVADADVKMVLFEDQFKEKISHIATEKLAFSQLQKLAETIFEVEKMWEDNRTITIMYTSGTTGFPKGVRQTAGNHTSSAISSVLNLGLSEEDCWLCTMPLFHISGFSILVRSVLYGMPVRLFEKFDAKSVTTEIVDGTVTRMSVVSVMLEQILTELETRKEQAHATFKTMLAGGGSVPTAYLKRAEACAMPVLQTYGMTETSSQTATLSSEDAFKKIGSSGKPLFFNAITIKGASTPGEHGEVLVKGPHVTPGYVGRFHERSPLEEGWLATGDIGYLDEDGYLFIVDRRSDLIISGGENVYPAEIENVLSSHPNVLEAGVCGMQDEKWGETPVAFVVKKGEVTTEALHQYCMDKLAKYKHPTRIIFVEQLPRNASNKLLRRELKKWLP